MGPSAVRVRWVGVTLRLAWRRRAVRVANMILQVLEKLVERVEMFRIEKYSPLPLPQIIYPRAPVNV